MQRGSALVPLVEIETDRSIAVKQPLPHGRLHYVIIPKRDLKNIGDITPADSAYVLDVMLVARQLIERHHMHNYNLYTNGPELQSVTYWHFHLVDNGR
jgi:diadenosine tetraphosphate (Ap4A) HIT family hydrolase